MAAAGATAGVAFAGPIRPNEIAVEAVGDGARKKGVPVDLPALLALDADVTALKGQVQALRERRNALSKAFAAARGDAPRQAALSAESRGLGEELGASETRLREREAALHDL